MDELIAFSLVIGMFVFSFNFRRNKEIKIFELLFPFLFYKKNIKRLVGILIASILSIITTILFLFNNIKKENWIYDILVIFIFFIIFEWIFVFILILNDSLSSYYSKQRINVNIDFFAPILINIIYMGLLSSCSNSLKKLCIFLFIIYLILILKDVAVQMFEILCKTIENNFKYRKKEKTSFKDRKKEETSFKDLIKILSSWFMIVILNLSTLQYMCILFMGENAFYLSTLKDDKARFVKNYFDCLYYTIITFSTVGFGDIRPNDIYEECLKIPQIITIVMVIFGMFFNIVFVSTLLAHVVGSGEEKEK